MFWIISQRNNENQQTQGSSVCVHAICYNILKCFNLLLRFSRIKPQKYFNTAMISRSAFIIYI